MDRFEVSTLRSYYGALLTDRQNEMLIMHYDEDLSFGEIADITGISRQAVLNGINQGEKHLALYEQKLGLVKKDRRIHELLDSVDTSDSEIKRIIANVKEILED